MNQDAPEWLKYAELMQNFQVLKILHSGDKSTQADAAHVSSMISFPKQPSPQAFSRIFINICDKD